MQHQQIIERVRDYLIDAARKRELVIYEDLLADSSMGLVDKPGKTNDIGIILQEISRDEVSVGNPPISAICVRKKDGVPGPEFRSFVDPANQMNEQQIRTMWQFIRDAVFNHFDKSKNKNRFAG